jgi:hypothetical protein
MHSRIKLSGATLLLSAVAVLSMAADKRQFVSGTVISIDVITIPETPKKVDHRYTCVVSDGTYAYSVEYEKPLKAAVHDPVKVLVEKNKIVILDSDGKERSARIEKRERLVQP